MLGPKGAPEFNNSAEYFSGKKVLFTALASSGEFYFRALGAPKGAPTTALKAASHGAAIDALSRGAADYVIVKNRVWDKEKAKYANLALVGQDKAKTRTAR